jgi:hypothetical protein
VTVAQGTIEMTFDTYGHLMPGGREQARDAADVYLAQGTSPA